MPRIALLSTLLALGSTLFAPPARADDKGQWVPISETLMAKIGPELKKQNYGPTAGVMVDPSTGDVYMVVSDAGLWKSSDQGKTFERVDNKTVSGRCETGWALNFDPAGKRLACFMIYGSSARTEDAGKTFVQFKTSHLDFGAVDWGATGKALLGLRHESGGVLTLSTDGGITWTDIGKKGDDKKVVKEDKGFRALGMFDEKILLGSKGAGILRSTDGGATWTQVSDAKLTAPVMMVRNGVGYWATDKGILATKDKGATWEPFAAGDAVFGPWFGKDDNHIVVVGKKGFQESTDGGKTWAVVAPFPKGVTEVPNKKAQEWTMGVGLVGPNYAWDPIHNVFYASSMGKHTYKFER